MLLHQLGAWLRKEGCLAEAVTDRAGARAALAAKRFDLLLLDLNLPDGSGLDLVPAPGSLNHGVPVVVLTGAPSLQSAMQAVQLRILAYLAKPPDVTELRRLIKIATDLQRERRSIEASRERLRVWEKELDELERGLDRPDPGSVGLAHLRLTLHQLGSLLVDLDRSLAEAPTVPDAREPISRLELVACLRRTAEALEATRVQFRSRALGDMRKQIESLLERNR